jgi:hypothetical protein
VTNRKIILSDDEDDSDAADLAKLIKQKPTHTPVTIYVQVTLLDRRTNLFLDRPKTKESTSYRNSQATEEKGTHCLRLPIIFSSFSTGKDEREYKPKSNHNKAENTNAKGDTYRERTGMGRPSSLLPSCPLR